MLIFNIRNISFSLCIWSLLLSTNSILAQNNNTLTKWKNFAQSSEKIKNFPDTQDQQVFLAVFNQAIQLQEWKNKNCEVLRVLDKHHLIIRIDQQAYLANKHKFKNLYPANHNWKLSHQFTISENENTSEIIEVLFKVNSTTCLKAIAQHFHPTAIQHRYQNIYHLQASQDKIINQLLPLDCVSTISQESQNPKMESEVLSMNLNPNKVNLIKRYRNELNGQDKLISIKENLYDSDDLDLLGKDKASPTAAEAVSNHTTDMATIIAGNGNSSFNGYGVAEKANISSSDFSQIFPDEDQVYQDLNITIQNHSYGTEIENFYGLTAQAYDQSSFTNPNLLHVFSAGNEGYRSAPEDAGTYTDINTYANLTGNFKMAKNILTVGAVDTVGRVVYFSSRGPAYDGRIKPELVAYSTEGTSNAAATVSGVVALLQEAYIDQYGQAPSSALIKAILLNAAKDVESVGIDYKTGFGNMDAYRSLRNMEEGLFYNGAINPQQELSLDLPEIPENATNLKITLVWTDAAAMENATSALVNDIDMELITPTGSVLLPWVLNATPDSTALAELPKRAVDHLNNIEQITLATPVAGQYELVLKGFDIADGPLPFSIAYQWDLKDQFSWIFPTTDDNMPFDGKTTSYFRWESSFDTNQASLDYSLDAGANWISIDENVNLQQSHYRWEIPADVQGVAIARMRIGNQEFITEKFTISRRPILRIGFNCDEEVLLTWNNYPNATKYKIFSLDNETNLMTETHSTTDSFYLFQKSDFDNNYLAVQAMFEEDMPGVRSVAVDYELLSAGCYFNSFYIENISTKALNVRLDIGTNYRVDKIIFERANNASFVPIGEINFPEDISFDFLDTNPKQGYNQYRAKLILEDGEVLFSEIADAYFLSTQDFLVFPNPVPNELGFNIFSKNFSTEEVQFDLYTSSGQLVRSKVLTTDREYIQTKGLVPGVYIYRLSSSNLVEQNKIIIR